jgi:hypothetical protein
VNGDTVNEPALHEVALLDEVDRDGAIREAAEAVRGDTRADLFRKGGILALGGLGIGGVGAGGSLALGKGSAKGDKSRCVSQRTG